MADIQFDPSLIEPIPGSSRRKKDAAPRVDPDADIPYTPPAITKSARGKRAGELQVIETGLTQMFGMMAMGLSMYNLYDGMVIGENAAFLAKHWTKVAERNATVRTWLMKALSGGDWLTAIVATAAVGLPIAANHGAVEPQFAVMATNLGVTVPEPVEAFDITEWNGNQNGDNPST